MTVLALLATLIGRAQRADARSLDPSLPKDQRDFHAGRREGYLQCIALLGETQVSAIREGVLGHSRGDHPSVKEARVYHLWPR